MKKFLITIDTEGDYLWGKKAEDPVTTENAKSLERFQNLCEEFGFKPTYLTNYEMAMDSSFLQWCKPRVAKECEIGMHLHPWNTPPLTKVLKSCAQSSLPYVTEYDEETIERKIRTITNLLSDRFECEIISHRAGRWSTNLQYLDVLRRCGYKIDSSYTPHKDWSPRPGYTSGACGCNYSNVQEQPFLIFKDASPLLEVPVTVRRAPDVFFMPNHWKIMSFRLAVRQKIRKSPVWFRPDGENLSQLKWLLETIANENESDYLMFMIHSSELLPGGSPTFKTHNSIEDLYRQLRKIFKKLTKYYEGETLGNYGLHKIKMLEHAS